MLIIGNRLGVGADGVTPLGNGYHGIFLSGNHNLIGGTEPGEGNIIAHHGTVAPYYSGVRVGNTGVGNIIRGNRIYANSQLGIDLRWPDGVNVNDLDDPDTGGNNSQNYPVLTAATSFNASLIVTGTLNSTANLTFTLDFYSSSACDNSGYGEGEVYLGAGQVTTDANGDAAFTLSVAGVGAQRTMLGLFRFWNVPSGSYTITPWWPALNPIAAKPNTNGAVSLPAVAAGIVRGTAWLDVNADGMRQPWESPLAGVPVTLTGQTQATDEHGRYAFYGIPAGSYTLTANLPTGLTTHIDGVVVATGRGSAIGIAVQTAGGFRIYLPLIKR